MEATRNQEATVYVGNIDESITEALLTELMVQCGPVVKVFMPKDRVSATHSGFGFCEFRSPADAEYAVNIMNHVKLCNKPLKVNRASMAADKRNFFDIGAEIFVGNLAENVDVMEISNIFSRFGQFARAPTIETNSNLKKKKHAFIAYTSFEASDAAIEAMNGQFLMNQPIKVSYAYKKDGKGARHGDEAERRLALAFQRNLGKVQAQTLAQSQTQAQGLTQSLPQGPASQAIPPWGQANNFPGGQANNPAWGQANNPAWGQASQAGQVSQGSQASQPPWAKSKASVPPWTISSN